MAALPVIVLHTFQGLLLILVLTHSYRKLTDLTLKEGTDESMHHLETYMERIANILLRKISCVFPTRNVFHFMNTSDQSSFYKYKDMQEIRKVLLLK